MKTIQEICEMLLEHISECEEREYCDGDDLYIFETGIEAIKNIASKKIGE